MQDKLSACQRQVSQLQHEMQQLRQGFETLEASHKAQEQQLERSSDVAAKLKESLRSTTKQVSRPHTHGDSHSRRDRDRCTS